MIVLKLALNLKSIVKSQETRKQNEKREKTTSRERPPTKEINKLSRNSEKFSQ